jgi:hypothetical protein
MDLGIAPDWPQRLCCRMREPARVSPRTPDTALCRTYFLRRAAERLAARKEIPARIAFCCTAAAVRPSFLAT